MVCKSPDGMEESNYPGTVADMPKPQYEETRHTILQCHDNTQGQGYSAHSMVICLALPGGRRITNTNTFTPSLIRRPSGPPCIRKAHCLELHPRPGTTETTRPDQPILQWEPACDLLCARLPWELLGGIRRGPTEDETT